MLRRPIRPLFAPNSLNKYKPFSTSKKGSDKKQPLRTEHELRFSDIVESCLNAKVKSQDLINLIMVMQQEAKTTEALAPELDYQLFFSLFVASRKIKLLRFLFNNKGFKFTIGLFLRALDLEAYDIAALLHKEFFRLIRDVNSLD